MKYLNSIRKFFVVVITGGILVGLCTAALLPGFGVLATANTGDDHIDIV